MPKDKLVSLIKQHVRVNQSKAQAEKKGEDIRRTYDPSYNPKAERKRLV